MGCRLSVGPNKSGEPSTREAMWLQGTGCRSQSLDLTDSWGSEEASREWSRDTESERYRVPGKTAKQTNKCRAPAGFVGRLASCSFPAE